MEPSEFLFHAQLEDYRTIRDELLGAISNQHMALTFGTGALVAALGAGFLSWNQSVAPAIFFGVVPLSWWILTMWLGEVVRMLRAGQFCFDQEQLINESIRSLDPSLPNALRWESWVRQSSPPFQKVAWTYVSVALLFLFTNGVAMAGGTVTAIQDGWAAWVVTLAWALAVSFGLLFARWVLTVFQAWTRAGVTIPPSALAQAFSRLPLSITRHR
jgi:hypothetical protein